MDLCDYDAYYDRIQEELYNRVKHDNPNSWIKQGQRGRILMWKDPLTKLRNGNWIHQNKFPKVGLESCRRLIWLAHYDLSMYVIWDFVLNYDGQPDDLLMKVISIYPESRQICCWTTRKINVSFEWCMSHFSKIWCGTPQNLSVCQRASQKLNVYKLLNPFIPPMSMNVTYFQTQFQLIQLYWTLQKRK